MIDADDEGNSVQQTSDGGYIIAGTTGSHGAGESDVWLIKTNASGDTTWSRTFGGTNDDAGKLVQQTSDGGYIVAGWTSSYSSVPEGIWLLKLAGDNTEGATTLGIEGER